MATNNLKYTLPFGSKIRLDSLTSDLTYMLATESDGDNEGTLRVVDKNGKFIMPMARLKEELIWQGSATTGTYDGAKYTYLRVVMNNVSQSPCSHIIKAGDTVQLSYSDDTSHVYINTTFSTTGFSSVTGNGGSSGTTWLSRLQVKEVYGIY